MPALIETVFGFPASSGVPAASVTVIVMSCADFWPLGVISNVKGPVPARAVETGEPSLAVGVAKSVVAP